MVNVFGNNIVNAFTGGNPVKAIYSNGVKVWPGDTGHWVNKLWNVDIQFGSDVWKDNDGHIYYSYNTRFNRQLELVDGEWIDKQWVGYNGIEGMYIWHDNDGHIYYTRDRREYELVDGKWVLRDLSSQVTEGDYIWHDNDGHTYFSDGNYNFQLELVDGVWVDKEWGDKKPYFGSWIWHDTDGHIYYSIGDEQWELVNGVWVDKDWGGYVPAAHHIWSDNDGHTYHSLNNGPIHQQWELVNGVWVDKDWGRLVPQFGNDVWKDNDGHIYCSTETEQLELIMP